MSSPATMIPCPVCNSNPRSFRHAWLFRCDGCGLLSSSFEPNIPATSNISIIDEEQRNIGLDATRRHNNSLILAKLAALCGCSGGRLLDVGCGLGYFLRDAKALGFDTVGIEPDANVIGRARKLSGVCIHHGLFPDVLDENDRFDVIIFNDAYEHIPNPERVAAAAARHLAIGGILVLNCPSSDGIFYRIADRMDCLGLSSAFNRMWQVDLPSPHLWYFRSGHLVRLGERAGLRHVASMSLLPLVREGLRERIGYVRTQSPMLSSLAYWGVSGVLPFLKILPRDICAVYLQASDSH
jgi:SAM-dependent methyltransferase